MGTPLRTKMEHDLAVRGIAERTGHNYLRFVADLARHYGRAPDTLTLLEVEAYLLHLRQVRQLTPESIKTVVTGLRFFYHVTLRRSRSAFYIPAPRRTYKEPEVLSRAEVARLLNAMEHRRDRMLLRTTYAAGLRVSEVVALQVAHLDSARMAIRIEQGKGRQDRYALLTERLLAELRAYWRVARPTSWLFPRSAWQDARHVSTRTASRAYAIAKARAGITKRGGIHSLRHAFATHLVERRFELLAVQCWLGHRHSASTEHYLHLAPEALARRGSACDLLDFPPPPPR